MHRDFKFPTSSALAFAYQSTEKRFRLVTLVVKQSSREGSLARESSLHLTHSLVSLVKLGDVRLRRPGGETYCS